MTDPILEAPNPPTDDPRWNLLKRKASEARACKAFELFRDEGVEPILIKGLAAARYYPESVFRDAIDMDLAVAAADFETSARVVSSTAANGLAIDLHRELRHLDTVPWSDLFDNSELLEMETGCVRILRPEDHLRVLCVHWLTDGGANKDRLWDIYYAVANRSDNFDWNRFLNIVDQKRQQWLISTLGVAQRFLGLDLSDTPIKNAADQLPAWLVRTIEREWASDTPYWPLFSSLHDRSLFLKQLGKRIPPNPITATVLLNGSFDAQTRVFYQIGTVLQRLGPSLLNISKALQFGSK